jgi:hypothetical protein
MEEIDPFSSLRECSCVKSIGEQWSLHSSGQLLVPQLLVPGLQKTGKTLFFLSSHFLPE